MAIKGANGFNIDLTNANNEYLSFDQLIFSESHGRYIIGSPPKNREQLIALAQMLGVKISLVGRAEEGDDMSIKLAHASAKISLEEARHTYENAIPSVMEARPNHE
ncbi:MAG: AIR synthase-related protein [Candidatus Ranarchaeia archaeon]